MHREVLGSIWKLGRYPIKASEVLSGSYWSQCFKILCIPLGRQSVLCKWKLRCWSSFCLLFQFFIFSFCHSYTCNTYGHFLSNISQQLLELGFWNLVQSLIVMKCIHIAYQYLYLFIFLSLLWKFLSQIFRLLGRRFGTSKLHLSPMVA